jgi:hypothetical protein
VEVGATSMIAPTIPAAVATTMAAVINNRGHVLQSGLCSLLPRSSPSHPDWLGNGSRGRARCPARFDQTGHRFPSRHQDRIEKQDASQPTLRGMFPLYMACTPCTASMSHAAWDSIKEVLRSLRVETRRRKWRMRGEVIRRVACDIAKEGT